MTELERCAFRLPSELIMKMDQDARKEHSDRSTIARNIIYAYYDSPVKDSNVLEKINANMEKIVRLLSKDALERIE